MKIQKYILYGGANCERLGDCEESEFCINNFTAKNVVEKGKTLITNHWSTICY